MWEKHAAGSVAGIETVAKRSNRPNLHLARGGLEDNAHMCRRPAVVCIALGPDPGLWPTTQPLPTPPGAMAVARAVAEAVTAAHAGDANAACNALLPLDQLPLQDWFRDHAQHAYRFRAAVFCPEAVITVPKADRDRPYPLAAMEREVYMRDGGRCRYCGIPVQLRGDLRRVNAVAGDELFEMGSTNRRRAGAMIIARASADHVVPVTQGGRTTPGNLVTACWPCQFGKSSFTPEQLGMRSPLA